MSLRFTLAVVIALQASSPSAQVVGIDETSGCWRLARMALTVMMGRQRWMERDAVEGMILGSEDWRPEDKGIALKFLIPWSFETQIGAMPADREDLTMGFGDFVYQNCRDGHPQLFYPGID
jgi:hypothetical protein